MSTPSGEGVLANFFNSLLNKKTGSPGGVGASPSSLGANVGATASSGGGGGGPGSLSGNATPRNLSAALNNGGTPLSSLNADAQFVDKMSVRNDAAAELERLTRTAASAAAPVKRDIDFTQSDC